MKKEKKAKVKIESEEIFGRILPKYVLGSPGKSSRLAFMASTAY